MTDTPPSSAAYQPLESPSTGGYLIERMTTNEPLLDAARSASEGGDEPRSWSNTSSRKSKVRMLRLHFRRYRRRKWFIPLFVLVVVLVLGGIIGGSFSSYMKTSFAFRSRAGILNESNNAVLMSGKVTNVDLVNAKISVVWTIFGCGPELSNMVADQACSTPDYPVDIYLNENTTYAAHPRSADNATVLYDPKKRAYGFDPKGQTYFWSTKDNGFSWGFWQTFSTDLPFSIDSMMSSKTASDVAYPWDKYKTLTSFLAVRPDTKVTYPVAPTFLGTISNWAVSSDTFPSNATDGFDWIDPNSQQLKVTIERSGAVMAFAICIFIVNWTITLVVLFQLFLTLIWRIEFAESFVLFPISALFAMPALRSAAPGNPSFGSFYDVCGFVLQISLVGLSSAIILLSTLFGDEHAYDPKAEGLSRAQVFRDFEALHSRGKIRHPSVYEDKEEESEKGERGKRHDEDGEKREE